MKARLFSKYGKLKGMSFEIDEDALVGRSPECTIALQDGAISGRHARIAYDTRLTRKSERVSGPPANDVGKTSRASLCVLLCDVGRQSAVGAETKSSEAVEQPTLATSWNLV